MDTSAMTSAMSGSCGRARHPRRAGRLPLLVLLAFVVLSVNRSVKAENQPDPPGDAYETPEISLVISSCDDLPNERTDVYGLVMVMGDIVCPENRIIRPRQSMSGDVVFASDSPINMKGVQFEVPTDTLMAFGAPLLNFERGEDSTRPIFTVQGTLVFLTDEPLPSLQGSTPDDKHSIMRVQDGGSIETDGILCFTDSALTVAKGVVSRDSRWAQRPRHQNHQTGAPPLASMFAPPVTTRESFEDRLKKSPMYLNVGDELHWPSSMSSEDGTELTLGVDGSLLMKKRAAAAEEEDESDPMVQPVVTLIAADLAKPSRVLKKRLVTGDRAVDVDLPGRKNNVKVPGGPGRDAGGRTILKITHLGDVEVTIDGKLVLRKTSPTNQRTWKRKISNWVKGRKRPKGNFQMHLVSNGFEVRLDGETIWGVYSAELPPGAS